MRDNMEKQEYISKKRKTYMQMKIVLLMMQKVGRYVSFQAFNQKENKNDKSCLYSYSFL